MPTYPSDVLVDSILRLVLAKSHTYADKCLYLQHPDYHAKEQERSNLPPCQPDHVRVVVVSDTHDRQDCIGAIPNCDVLIHCGDILMTNRFFSKTATLKKVRKFNEWLGKCPAKQRYVIAGNHDRFFEILGKENIQALLSNGNYVINENVSLGNSNLTAWATPLSSGKSRNRAFQSKTFMEMTLAQVPIVTTGEEGKESVQRAEAAAEGRGGGGGGEGIDVLITHGHCPEVEEMVPHELHIWGHNHNSYGVYYPGDSVHKQPVRARILSLCSPLMDGHYQLRNLPFVLDLPVDRQRLQDAVSPSRPTPAPKTTPTHQQQQQQQTPSESISSTGRTLSSGASVTGVAPLQLVPSDLPDPTPELVQVAVSQKPVVNTAVTNHSSSTSDASTHSKKSSNLLLSSSSSSVRIENVSSTVTAPISESSSSYDVNSIKASSLSPSSSYFSYASSSWLFKPFQPSAVSTNKIAPLKGE
mmetsp:Transcript_3500/g.5770  ORF Transcript_3500/g.5770 Transcript_3500/m.5770 type:complete len:471 (+) Transcript_3500:39-1451(+)